MIQDVSLFVYIIINFIIFKPKSHIYILIINLELERFNKAIKKTETSLTSSSQQKDSYSYEEKLGQGAYGEVFRATKKGTIVLFCLH